MKTHPLPPEKSKEEQRVELAVRLMKELDGDKPKAESYHYSVSRMLIFVLWVLMINQVIQTFLLLRGK